MRLGGAVLAAAAVTVFLPAVSPAAEWHQIAYSKKFAVEVFGEMQDGRWCHDALRLRVEVANKAFFHKDEFPTLMQKLFFVFNKECPDAAVADVDVYAADTQQRISGGNASRADNWTLRSLDSLASTVPQISRDEVLQDKLGNREFDKIKEENAWLRANDSFDVAVVRGYLDRYPNGRFADEAADRLAMLERQASIGEINYGNYHALVIGINDYKGMKKLTTAVADAKAVAQALNRDYGFQVRLLLDATRGEIIEALDEYLKVLGPDDNLLIYYAGHGHVDDDVGRGYWLPVNAESGRRTNWVSNATITDTLKGLSAKHVMVVADSCYSGMLVRDASAGIRKRGGDHWKKMAEKWARVAITSGGNEPVADKGRGGHSPFAKAFLDTLAENNTVMDGNAVFGKLRESVTIAANQTPEYSPIQNAGHEGGDFLFVRKQLRGR